MAGHERRGPVNEAMGIDWMRRPEDVAEAIPPCFTRWIGEEITRAGDVTESASPVPSAQCFKQTVRNGGKGRPLCEVCDAARRRGTLDEIHQDAELTTVALIRAFLEEDLALARPTDLTP